MRGQHSSFQVRLFGETDRNDFEGGSGHAGGVAVNMRQSDDDGIAAVSDSTVKGLRFFFLLAKRVRRAGGGWVVGRSGRSVDSSPTARHPPPPDGCVTSKEAVVFDSTACVRTYMSPKCVDSKYRCRQLFGIDTVHFR